jgi:hypothetical protein
MRSLLLTLLLLLPVSAFATYGHECDERPILKCDCPEPDDIANEVVTKIVTTNACTCAPTLECPEKSCPPVPNPVDLTDEQIAAQLCGDSRPRKCRIARYPSGVVRRARCRCWE